MLKFVFAMSLLVVWLPNSSDAIRSKCRVASYRLLESEKCVIKFGYMTSPPDWIDAINVLQSFKNATEVQIQSLAREICRCRLLRVSKECPSALSDVVYDLSWKCLSKSSAGVIAEISKRLKHKQSKPKPETQTEEARAEEEKEEEEDILASGIEELDQTESSVEVVALTTESTQEAEVTTEVGQEADQEAAEEEIQEEEEA